jgi:hypothetical protein
MRIWNGNTLSTGSIRAKSFTELKQFLFEILVFCAQEPNFPNQKVAYLENNLKLKYVSRKWLLHRWRWSWSIVHVVNQLHGHAKICF